jgi:hypothetical protein
MALGGCPATTQGPDLKKLKKKKKKLALGGCRTTPIGPEATPDWPSRVAKATPQPQLGWPATLYIFINIYFILFYQK